MTLIVDALSRAARQCSVTPPTNWITSTKLEIQELRDDFLPETASDILDRLDLPSPIGKQTTIAGDGSETYTLPSDFKRLARDQRAVYDGLLDRPCIPVNSDGDWTYLKDIGTAGTIRYYRTSGYDGAYSISFYNAPTSSDITVSYVSGLWMADSGGTAGSAFTDLTDVLLLPRRAIEAGIVYRFRERKGLPYLDKFNEYELLLTRLGNDSRGRRTVNMGETDYVRWQDLVPSYIPDS